MGAGPQSSVARLFDAMADDYDRLEPWYEHLYERLHAILVNELAPRPGDTRALDAGCGHGAQAALLQRLGYDTHGIDIAGRLLALARCRVPDVTLGFADVATLPYRDATFDAVTCLGSTLSFVADTDGALGELARVLRTKGRLLLECEHKWSVDLGWTIASTLTGDLLGYGVSFRTLRRALMRPLAAPIVLPYPGYGALTLLSGRDLRRRLAAVGLRWHRAWGIHAATNLIPSTVLHRRRLPRALAVLYRALCRLDGVLGDSALGRAGASSLVVLAVKS